MREARRSTSFKYTTWVLEMQRSWAFMRIRMNHLFHGVTNLVCVPKKRKEILSKFRGLKGSWKHIRTLEWNWKRDVTPVSSEMVRSLAQEEGADPYHLDLVLISLFFKNTTSPTRIE
ncbi:hypothetical protein ES319_A05G335900v1 [Gossypium barbadense]|uniref:Uncharacterized protein n=1 Tax=Gossypium barbadense TaxID=3634 RepID=A0A5J5VW78_GOSBA|nr:hypothetical protein ES319_A05G335900v1 [Gossypium barbadense]